MRTDPHKIQAVAEWPVPSSREDLKRFMGFANFYRPFICIYSQVAAPLTHLTSIKLSFQWSSEAEAAFVTLKNCFNSVPILVQPDPERQFVVEVDVSDSEVGSVLSQRAESEGKMHQCSEERNYDVSNRELLAVKLALEEWRHWLEGAKQPFLVWNDHKSLIYLTDAKRLNSGQVRWVLFFRRFNFSITYRPSTRNVKTDALSWQFSPSSLDTPDNILPFCFRCDMGCGRPDPARPYYSC